MIQKIVKALAPLGMLAGAALLSGCDGMNISIGGDDGVPLAELDMSGEPPTELVLAGPDRVVVTEGDDLDIEVSGDADAVAALRFSLSDETLAISRESDWKGSGIATVRVTTPSLTTLVLAGSGDIDAERMSGAANVTVAGSGTVKIARLEAESLDLTIAGSGDITASGSAGSLDLTVAGSGKAAMANLEADRAEVSIAGSGDAEFASDGPVEASIMGSGTVTVNGNADCTVSSMGSGKLRCRPAATKTSEASDESESASATTVEETD